jgi:hypothetical protein
MIEVNAPCTIQLGIPSENPMTYDEAVLYCFFYNQEGSTGWRMPTDIEWQRYAPDISPWALGDNEDYLHMIDTFYVALPVRDI